jgi:hypothetical protein
MKLGYTGRGAAELRSVVERLGFMMPSHVPSPGGAMRLARRAVLTLALLLVGLLGASPVAAAGEIEVLAVGWDGVVVPGSWSPVRLRVRGGAGDATARVEVVLLNRLPFGGPPGAATPTAVAYPAGAYGEELALPSGAVKELTIWVPIEGVATGSVRLLADGALIGELPLDFKTARAPFWPLVGVLADAPQVARAVGQIELPYEGLPVPLSVARLEAADLPASAERLRALSALVVQGTAPTMLRSDQRAALRDWVAAGGHLVVLGGPDGARAAAALPGATLPGALGALDGSTDLAPLATWAEVGDGGLGAGPAARIEATGGVTLAGRPDRPLAWRRELGQGTVTLLAVDPSLQPLAAWGGTPALLKKALEPALPTGAAFEQARAMRGASPSSASTRLQYVTEALPVEAFPTWRVAALILAAFALAVGPLLHLALRWVDRRELVWLVVPGAAIAAAAGLYVVGVGMGGRDVLTNVVAHVRLDPAGGPATGAIAAGFYSPTRPYLEVAAPADMSVRVFSRGAQPIYGPAGPQAPTSSEAPFHVVGGRRARVELAGAEWGMRTVAVEGPLASVSGSIVARLALDGGLIRGTVRNDTPYPLEDAAVVVGRGMARVGSLAPGQTAAVAIDPGPAGGSFGVAPLSYRLFGRTPEELAASGSAGASGMMWAAPAAPPIPAYAPPPVSFSATQPTATPPAPVGTPGPPATATPAPAPKPGVGQPYPITRGAGPMPTPMPVPGRGPYGPGPMLEIPRDPEVMRRMRLLDAVTNVPGRPGMGPGGAPSLPLTFMAFTRAPIAADLPTAGDHPTFHLALVEEPLQLELPPGPFDMPASLIPAEAVAQSGPGMGMGGDGQIQWLELAGGAAVVYGFRPPLPPGATLEAISIATRQIGASAPMPTVRGGPPPPAGPAGPAEADVFALYNWRTGGWDPLVSGAEQVTVRPANAHVGADGQLRVRVQAPPDRLVRVVPPEVAVAGRVGS